ncbi:ribosomal protein S5 domain 2-like protein [Hypoxylon fragiforme]|uniref:ribosomal protein S5 domain 2-like protein n=1 Tax=Hypoxylon fragiforme TaxID=63214 RepID=UPI0020C6690C|nr:ribosomal protein S5 domain 2-like protein [Hypoxylon fragiforme]KAI2604181.1 ribosomal protein S5 domain 2-like protein [Hypoxylon fragiforme]
MPLDSSIYTLGLLRIDGRCWKDLRHLNAQIHTQASADGSAYFEMGNTKVMCVINGPNEEGRQRRGGQASSSGAATGGGGSLGSTGNAEILVSIDVGGFSTVDRKKRARSDKRIQELQTTIANAFSTVLHTHLFPRSSISISLYVLSQDGSLLACLINAATLALIDAGININDYLVACTGGSTSSHSAADDSADPIVDLNGQEEQELPFLTVATLGATDKVIVLVCESRVQISRLEGMMVAAADGCKKIREYLDSKVRERGDRMVKEGAVAKGASMALDIEA